MVSHVGWSFLLLGSEEKECVLCHVNRSVLFERLAWKREDGEKWFGRPFYFAPGEVTRGEWHQSFSLGEIYEFELQRLKEFPH